MTDIYYLVESIIRDCYNTLQNQFQVDILRKKVATIKHECAKADAEAIQKACNKLFESQRTAVQACFDASKKMIAEVAGTQINGFMSAYFCA